MTSPLVFAAVAVSLGGFGNFPLCDFSFFPRSSSEPRSGTQRYYDRMRIRARRQRFKPKWRNGRLHR